MRKIILALGVLVLIICGCFICFVVHFAEMKRDYTAKLQTNINVYLQQQIATLSRLSDALIPVLQQKNYVQVAALLAIYEEITFAQAQQGAAVPINIHFVSLSAPQHIIGSFGELDLRSIASDSEYYSRVAEVPDQLAFSKIYTNTDMPEYPMLNFGLGISDRLGVFYGHLDVQGSIIILQQYFNAQLEQYASFFAFEINEQDFSRPIIKINRLNCWVLCLKFIIWRTLILSLGCIVLSALYMLREKVKQMKDTLLQQQQQILSLSYDLKVVRKAQAVQAQYGALHTKDDRALQIIILQQLLADVVAVNAEFAQQRAVQVDLPTDQCHTLRIQGNKLRLMQILSGILFEMILQQGAAGKIKIQVTLSARANDQQQLDFTFTDNGYYSKLQDRNEAATRSDVRCKGWSKINALVEQLGATLEYVHTAYSGNKIQFTVINRLVNNVVSLEEYLHEY